MGSRVAEDLAAHLLSETQNPRSPLAPAPVSAGPPWASPELRASALQRVDRSSLLLTSLNFSYLLSPNTATLEAKLQTGTWQGRKLSSVQQPVPQHLWVVPSGPGGGTWWGSRTGHTLLSEGQLAIPSEPNAQSTAARTLPEISQEGRQEQHGMGGAMQGARAAGTVGSWSMWAGGRTAAATREFRALAGAHPPHLATPPHPPSPPALSPAHALPTRTPTALSPEP